MKNQVRINQMEHRKMNCSEESFFGRIRERLDKRSPLFSPERIERKMTKRQKSVRGGIFLLVMILLSGCAQGQSQGQAEKEPSAEKTSFKIGITQIVDHKALNEARDGFKEKMAELGIETEFVEENAQGDVSNALIIANSFVSDKADLILSIATATTQAAQKATAESQIPVVFTTVSDPVSAGIVSSLENGSGNITGVTDAVTEDNLVQLMSIFKEIKPDAKALGVIFNTGEANSAAQVKMLKAASEKMGFALKEVGISEISNIDQAIETVASESDALMLINDNMIASSVGLISEKAKQKNLITLSSDSAHVEEGALLSVGISYRQLGVQAAEQAKKILVDKVKPSDIAIENSEQLFKFVNKSTAEALGIDIKMKELSDATFVG
ncbi:MAG: ABC transporter substrate-binding protein [Peptostreptococcaceae bacterium]|nr:ABC transporter substrate-binding protein [Peptostreptococcaceae bacterium]